MVQTRPLMIYCLLLFGFLHKIAQLMLVLGVGFQFLLDGANLLTNLAKSFLVAVDAFDDVFKRVVLLQFRLLLLMVGLLFGGVVKQGSLCNDIISEPYNLFVYTYNVARLVCVEFGQTFNRQTFVACKKLVELRLVGVVTLFGRV